MRKLLPRLVFCLVALTGGAAQADQQMEATLSAGLEAIHERALQPLPLGVITLEALRGLTALDPALDLAKDAHHRLVLRYRAHVIASYALPLSDDVMPWSNLLQRAAREAGRHSPAIGKADQDAVLEAMLDGALAKLDIFSHYAGPAEARERRAARQGFGGIGVRYDLHDDGITLTEVMPDSPATKANLRLGDHITAIDDDSLVKRDQGEISQKLRGPIGSSIKLLVKHGDAGPTATLILKRGLIVPPTVVSSLDQGIGLITVSAFNQNTASGVGDAVKKMRGTSGFKGIILDLRGNPGGLLDQAVAVADQFIDQGRILSTHGRHPEAAQSRDARPGDLGENIPLVVLIDGRTASAAEILTADLQDLAHAAVVGTNSFGKGAIQTVLDMPNGGEITLTWSRFFAPSGYALHGLGLLPAICTGTVPKVNETRTLAGGRTPAPDMVAAWRGVAPDDMQQRFKLRTQCLAADHKNDAADLAIARHLLNDHALMARAQAVTAPVSTASLLRGLPLLDHH